MKTVITNGIIITMNRDMDMYPEGYVIVEDNRISEVGPMAALAHRVTEWESSRQEGISIMDAGHGLSLIHIWYGDIEAAVFPVADILVLPVPLLPVSSNLLRVVEIAFPHIGWGVAVVPSVKERPSQLVFQVLKIFA